MTKILSSQEASEEIERLKEQIKPLQEITQSLLGEETVCRDRINSLEEKADELTRRHETLSANTAVARARLTALEEFKENVDDWSLDRDARLVALEKPNQSDCPTNEWAQRLERITSCDGGRTFQCQTCGNDLPTVKKKDERAETIRRARNIVNNAKHYKEPFEIAQFCWEIVEKALDIAEQSIKGGGE